MRWAALAVALWLLTRARRGRVRWWVGDEQLALPAVTARDAALVARAERLC